MMRRETKLMIKGMLQGAFAALLLILLGCLIGYTGFILGRHFQ